MRIKRPGNCGIAVFGFPTQRMRGEIIDVILHLCIDVTKRDARPRTTMLWGARTTVQPAFRLTGWTAKIRACWCDSATCSRENSAGWGLKAQAPALEG